VSPLSPEELDSAFDVALPSRPYPGLRPFEQHEWPIFFGRERMADEVVRLLFAQQLVVVHGDSGCGKSSLIRAGVMPRLGHECARGGLRWLTCTALPRGGPLGNLARALAGLDGRAGDEARVLEVRRTLNFGRDAASALAALLRRDLDGQVCVLIDQFEELFELTRRQGAEEARLLTELLIGVFEQRPPGLHVILTMRSEFLGACARFRSFAETVNATQYLLPRMTHADLVRAIREPALLYDGEVSAELAERLVADAGGGQDQLPLIQHGLMLLYGGEERGDAVSRGAESSNGPRWRLTLADYRCDGGLSGLLSEHADAIAEQSERAHLAGSAGSGRVVEDLFRALTDINPDGQGIRRPRRLAELVAVTGADEPALRGVIDAFRADGVSFLTPYGAEAIDGGTLIDLGHEALIRCWRRMADPKDGWLVREFRNGLVWRSLLVQADSFERDPDNVLSPATTEERETWLRRRNAAWAERYGGGWDRVVRLIEASAAARDLERRREEAERRNDEQRRLREQKIGLLRRTLAVLAIVAIAAAGAAAWALMSAREAKRQTDRANAANRELQAALAELQAALSEVDQERASAVASANELLRVVDQLEQAVAKSPDGPGYRDIQQVQRTLELQAEKLAEGDGATASVAQAVPLPPRVYIHVAEASQRRVAARLEGWLEQVSLGPEPGDAVLVPGIELVRTPPKATELRCFRKEDCAKEGPRLVAQLNDMLEVPDVVLSDQSARYGRTTGIRRRHYELWLAPGPVVLGSPASRK
jgi:hypothetical protein